MLIRDNDPEQAARLAKDALTLNRQSASAHYTLGLAALAVQNLNEAEASFNEVARINPRAGAAQLQLARIHLARGDAKKAAVVAAEAARANPNDVNAAALSVRSLRTAGERDRAERELDAKLKERPGSAVLNVEQGWLALQRQQLASARAAFGRALEADPVHREARAGLVATELAGGSTKSARVLVENWLAESPSDVSLRILLAQVQLRAGDSGAAERTLRDVVVSTPSAVEAYELLARLYVAAGDLDRAANEYRALHERRPSAPGPLTMIGLINESQGDRTAARAQYTAGIGPRPRGGRSRQQPGVAERRRRTTRRGAAPGHHRTADARLAPGGRGHDRVGALSPRRLPRSHPVVTSRRRTGARSGQIPLPPRYGALAGGRQLLRAPRH